MLWRQPPADIAKIGAEGSNPLALFQRGIVEHRVGQKPLQLGVLILKLLQPVDQHRSGTPPQVAHNALILRKKFHSGWGPDRCRWGPPNFII